METDKSTRERVLAILIKEPFIVHTITSLAKTLKITRQGLWKTIGKLNEDKIISLKTIGKSKTSIATIGINWNTPLAEKEISLILTKEAWEYERWINNFSELSGYTNFVILFGSILHNPEDANDIDILAIVKKSCFEQAEKAVSKAQISQLKKIHFIDLSEKEFHDELISGNKAYLDALKKGVILSGIDEYINFIRTLK